MLIRRYWDRYSFAVIVLLLSVVGHKLFFQLSKVVISQVAFMLSATATSVSFRVFIGYSPYFFIRMGCNKPIKPPALLTIIGLPLPVTIIVIDGLSVPAA